MKTTLSSRLHASIITVAAILALFPLFNGSPTQQFVSTIIGTLFWLAIYFFFFFYLSPALLLPGKLMNFFGISIIVIAILPFIGYSLLFLSRALFKGDFTDFFQGYTIAMHISGLKAMALAGVYGSFFRLIAEYFRTERK